MKIELRTALTPALVEQLHALYRNEWWTSDRRLSDLEKMLQGSDFVFAYVDEDERLAGMRRVRPG